MPDAIPLNLRYRQGLVERARREKSPRHQRAGRLGGIVTALRARQAARARSKSDREEMPQTAAGRKSGKGLPANVTPLRRRSKRGGT